MKITAVAPSNIAFTKYWGRKDENLRIPENGSISMNLSNLITTTTVEFSDVYKNDEVIINGEKESTRVSVHLDRIRDLAKIKTRAKVVSKNNFPTGTGLSSSASGFAALTLAASYAADLDLSEKDLSILARLGSGSACRSIPSGFVEWVEGDTNETSYAKQIFPANYWNIADVVVVISSEKKDVATSVGQKTATSSPFMNLRLSKMKDKNKLLKTLIEKRDFEKFGQLVEAEALELHAIMLTQTPPLIYWRPETIILMKEVQKWRKEGLAAYFTVNTGQDMHIICQQKDAESVAERAKTLSITKDVIINTPCEGTRLVESHLF